MKNKQSMKVLATAVLISSSLALGGQPVQAMGEISGIDIVACEEGDVTGTEDVTTDETEKTGTEDVTTDETEKTGTEDATTDETEKTGTEDTTTANENDSTNDEKIVDETKKIVHIDEESFPDCGFREFVKEHCDADHDGYISELDVQNVFEMDCSASNVSPYIENVKGIEYFTRLQSLNLWGNVIEEIDLSKNTDLEELNVGNNHLNTIDLSANTKLKKVICSYNYFSKLDFSNLPELEVLECDNNRLGSLNVSKNPKLKELICWWNQLSSLDVSNNTALVRLGCSMNGLEKLDVSKNTALNYLYCDNDWLTSLDVSKNTALIELDCSANQLNALDVTNNKALAKLVCYNTRLKSLDVSQNTALEMLFCHNNEISSLDVSKNVELVNMDCSMNLLKELDVSRNAKLAYLSVNYNPMSKIDISLHQLLIEAWEKGEFQKPRVPYKDYECYASYGIEGKCALDVDVDDMVITGKFQDLEDKAWYEEAVLYVKDNAFMNGTSEVAFSPNMTLTRAQFVTVLHNIEGGVELPVMEYSDKFTDVPKDVWYTNPVMWALKNGITSGVDDDKFGTDLQITREQLATLLYKYAGIKGDEYILTKDSNALKEYPDATDVSDWATEAMQWAVSNGVMSGKPGTDGKNILNPKGNASRAECAQMVMNFITKATNFD